MEGLKIFSVDFVPVWPVGGCLIIAASNIEDATVIAKDKLPDGLAFKIDELLINKPQVIVYMSGEY